MFWGQDRFAAWLMCKSTKKKQKQKKQTNKQTKKLVQIYSINPFLIILQNLFCNIIVNPRNFYTTFGIPERLLFQFVYRYLFYYDTLFKHFET